MESMLDPKCRHGSCNVRRLEHDKEQEREQRLAITITAATYSRVLLAIGWLLKLEAASAKDVNLQLQMSPLMTLMCP